MILCLLLDSHSLKTYIFVFEARLYANIVRYYEINCMVVVALFNVDSVVLMLIGKDITRVIFVFFFGFLFPEIISIQCHQRNYKRNCAAVAAILNINTVIFNIYMKGHY